MRDVVLYITIILTIGILLYFLQDERSNVEMIYNEQCYVFSNFHEAIEFEKNNKLRKGTCLLVREKEKENMKTLNCETILTVNEIFDILETDRILNDNLMITKQKDLRFINMRYAKLIYNEIQRRKNL